MKLRARTSLIAVTLLTAVASATSGQAIDEDRKILALDGAAGDALGSSIALAQGIIAVGAPGDDDNGANSGSVYLLNASTGAQIAKLLPTDGAAGDSFGFSVAFDGAVVAVGAPGDDDNGAASGSAYLFDASTGAQLGKLLAVDGGAGDEFGYSIAIDNGVVAVGSIRDDDLADDSGSAYLFDASTGSQLIKLLPDDDGNRSFGISMAMDGGVVAIGARMHFDLDQGFTLDAVYLFDASSGDQLHKLMANNGTWTDFFGTAVDIDNGLVAVGAWARSIFFDHSGAAYVFDVSTGEQLHYFYPADGHDRDHFGNSISIDDGIVAVGAHQDGDRGWVAGSAYLFDALDGTQIDK
ncbi:MAG: FG-GAP repeat protein, partial [Phycisphaerales bacterium JB038]